MKPDPFYEDEEFMLQMELEQMTCPDCGHQTCGCSYLEQLLTETHYPLSF